MFWHCFLALCFSILPFQSYAADAVSNAIEFVIIIPSYNNEQWYKANLDSVVNQTYPHFSIHYINDCSQDKTGQLVDQYVKDAGLELKGKIQVTHNSLRRGAMANLFSAITAIDGKKVVVVVDGDDRLAHTGILDILAKQYADKSVWLTHGNYTTEPFTKASYCKEYPKKVQKKLKFRSSKKWMGCQLRTFYAKLFHLIKKEDLLFNGDFLPMTYDLGIMFPMLEMASDGHVRFIEEPIYIVNTVNPISDRKKNAKLQKELDTHLRNLPSYQPLKELF